MRRGSGIIIVVVVVVITIVGMILGRDLAVVAIVLCGWKSTS